MSNENKGRHATGKAAEFIKGRGFYVVLLCCLFAIGLTAFISLSAPGDENGQSEVSQSDDERLADAATPTPGTEAGLVSVPTPPTQPAQPDSEAQTGAEQGDDITGAAVSPKDTDLMFAPVEGAVLMAFADDSLLYSKTLDQWTSHNGIDIAAPVGTPVRAAADGVVKSVENDLMMGYTITLSHADELETTYSNLDALPTFSPGDSISAGAQIGEVGESAIAEIAEEPHLHFELRRSEKTIDPLPHVRGLMSLPVK